MTNDKICIYEDGPCRCDTNRLCMTPQIEVDLSKPSWLEVFTPIFMACIMIACVGSMGLVVVISANEALRQERQLAMDARR
ncbi:MULTISPECIES: hypothetical protein [unclassified Shinella]|uniref:hypothetical protein n=1 Tax=unclassified Shinella TaxID=2643062 RepID=UPI00225DCA49|nr:hypothetical protein SHINE37_44642 [Rhizobiaceae bacterium]CAK7259122.1 protein of unknown function [Shinella sp. WSC3-e]